MPWAGHRRIVWWRAMQVVRYAAGDWGVGELWLDGGRAPRVARAADEDARAHAGRPPEGGAAPPTITLAGSGARVRSANPCRKSRGGSPRTSRASRSAFDDVPIDLGWCTPCQRAIADALRGVPYGETVTYGELAALAGRPQAPRAGGAFCAQNRLPLIFPCHRVVAAGGIGGYGSLGVEYKRRLLELEGASL